MDQTPFMGPLFAHPDNSRYFTDQSGKVIFLTGSHTWANFQDDGVDTVTPFDYTGYLDMLEKHHHNFFRLWTWEQAEGTSWSEERVVYDPLPYMRTGPGNALDGKPKFNLECWNQAYFDRLRDRIIKAGERGIYVSVMLFQGFSIDRPPDPGHPWRGHPLNASNNLQAIGPELGTLDEDGKPTLHSLANPAVLVAQESYIRKVVDTVGDLDNVLYEIINEGGTIAWQYYIIDYVHDYEKRKYKQHPVGMTHRINPSHHNHQLYESHADWISPTNEPIESILPGSVPLIDYKDQPPPADGRKVVISDTDHLWGHGGNSCWVWKSFMRGLNTLFMDSWQPVPGRLAIQHAPYSSKDGIDKNIRDYPDWEPVRLNLGYTRRFAERVNLLTMQPHPELASTRYCLARPESEYLVYFPVESNVTIDLTNSKGIFDVEWYFPALNRSLRGASVLGGDYLVFSSHFYGDAVIYLKNCS